MACLHPNYVIWKPNDFDGTRDFRFCGSASALTADLLKPESDVSCGTQLVPCGKCMGCRLDRASAWADRMLIEFKDNGDKAIFVTLTYNDDHLPEVVTDDNRKLSSLSVRDTQLFLKRLRKAFSPNRIRFYLAGEYGPKTHRPHYHAILFGLSLDDFPDAIVHSFNGLGQPLYQSDVLAGLWQNGFVSLAPATRDTASYCARYTMKKRYKGEDVWLDPAQQPEFSTQSRRPGIGLLHAKELLASGDKAFVCDSNALNPSLREIYLGRAFMRNVHNKLVKDIVSRETEIRDLKGLELENPDADSYIDSLRSEIDSLLSEFGEISSRAFNRAQASLYRTFTNLSDRECNIEDYYRDKEEYFLSRIGLLPERR
uniref:Replication initiator protein n=1 Tax=Dulem virus 194 TaxID=3145671 RepID=A0AAU8AVU2_9VIRU